MTFEGAVILVIFIFFVGCAFLRLKLSFAGGWKKASCFPKEGMLGRCKELWIWGCEYEEIAGGCRV